MLIGYERAKDEAIDMFMDRVNAGVEALRDASVDIQGPNLQIAADGSMVAAIQCGKVEAIRTPNGVVPAFRQFTRAYVNRQLADKRECKGAFKLVGN